MIKKCSPIDKAVQRAEKAAALFTTATDELEASTLVLDTQADQLAVEASALLAEAHRARQEASRNRGLIERLLEFTR